MPNKTIEYNLSNPIKVSKNGDFVEENLIIITEPVYRDIHKANILQQQFLIATQNITKTVEQKEEVKAEKELLGKDYFSILMIGNGNLELCINTLKELLKNGATIGNIKITDTILEKISIKDFNNLLGEYLKSFLLVDLI